ncbi:MAG: UvrD-helicase domain-containing protein [Eggerthellaceae bacterium]|nr:UvrD-helicase domain-containing protein [Eggerthellaceae bacterium]
MSSDPGISAPCTQDAEDNANDPIFQQEQAHLSEVHAILRRMGRNLAKKLAVTNAEAAKDKQDMADELALNFAGDDETLETAAELATINRIIEAYNISQDVNARKLADVQTLLKQPYFAKVVLQFKAGDQPKELYIGTAGIADENYRRLVVDWRSPVAETYYNQENGRTSYHANGRIITADLKLRRQFDIVESMLNAYFDTTVAIQDALLLKSLSHQRTDQMKAITATIQKEQNQVIRHEDVPVLLVSGIAGSGKTSVLLQRIAYLLYQRRDDLDPSQVYLITPNPVFRHYIDNVLPELGERNPETITWAEFAERLLPKGRGGADADSPIEELRAIDEACKSFSFEPDDFRDIACQGTRLISAGQIRQLRDKYSRFEAGPHLVALMREDLEERLENRLKSMAGSEAVQNEILDLPLDEQLRLFNGPFDPQDEREERELALHYVTDRYDAAFHMVENDEWLRLDRIGMRLLGIENLSPAGWLYLKMAVTGLGNPDAKYVMIDEVQDYTAAQLAVLARYFRRAHFMLLGDPNQAIKPHTASFDEIKQVFERSRGPVEECFLMTSYRSAPSITNLFAGLLSAEERGRISSVQREEMPPRIRVCNTEESHAEALRETVAEAQRLCDSNHGIAAVVVPWKSQARRIQGILDDEAPQLMGKSDALPSEGVILITLELAKGLEFDHVIVPDANPELFPDEPLARRRLYTTISRATRRVDILACGTLTPLLEQANEQTD